LPEHLDQGHFYQLPRGLAHLLDGDWLHHGVGVHRMAPPDRLQCPRWPHRHGMTMTLSIALEERSETARTHPAVGLKVSHQIDGHGQGFCCLWEV
jgi:hypothetical protein